MAMLSGEKALVLLKGAFQNDWDFHYSEDTQGEKPVGWSIKFGEKYHRIPSSLELQEGRIHYRKHLGALIELASKFEDILMDMRIHRPSEFTGAEGKTLSKDEKDILYLKTFL